MSPKVKAPFKLPVKFCRHTQGYITQDNTLHSQRSENNKEMNLFIGQYNFFQI